MSPCLSITMKCGTILLSFAHSCAGSVVDCSKDPLMSSLTKTVGAPAGGVVNGLPMLTPDLR